MKQSPDTLQKFISLHWYDLTINFVFQFAAKTSELLLAAGLIISAADFLTDGHVMQGNDPLSNVWAWSQAIAIESSPGVVLVQGLQSRTERDYVKTGAYALLGVLLAVVAGILLYVQTAAHTLSLTEATAVSQLGISPRIMAVLRAIVCIGYIALSRTKHKQFSYFSPKGNGQPKREEHSAPQHQAQEPQEPQPLRLEITPELIAALRDALTSVTVVEEVAETRQIAAAAGETNPLDAMLQQLDQMLPNVSLDEITAVVTTYRNGTGRRDMCKHLKWGGSKYTTIVKPVLDAYERQQQAGLRE
jgi:hypothetical protein